MDTNTARNVLTQMQSCFMESKLQIVTESEKLNQEDYHDYLSFRSYVADNGRLAEIEVVLWLNSEMVNLSMVFNEELSEAANQELLVLMNDINLSSAGFYWIAIPRLRKMEFRSAYLLPGDQFNKEQFKGVLRKFLDQGLQQYDYIEKLMASPGGLLQ